MSDPFTGYHGTPIRFSEFDEAMIGSRGESHVNSSLGFWFACVPDWVGSFGGHVLEAEIDLGKIHEIPQQQLFKMSMRNEHNREFFQDMRQRLISEGYSSIAIVEVSGSIDMYVVLQASSIRYVRDYELAPAPAP